VRRLIAFFVDNYVLTFSVFGSLVLFGIVSSLRLGVDLLPEFEIPIVAVSTVYNGASPEEIARSVAEPIEGQLATLPGISAVTSISSEGFGIVIAQFNAGVNVDAAAIDVSSRVSAVASALPEGAQTPSVQKFDPADEPILSVAVAAPGESLSAVQRFAEDELQGVLRRVDGVADVSVVGPAAREVQVLFDPALLASYGLTPQALVGAVGAAAVDVSAGSLTVADNRLLLAGRGTPETLSAIEEIRIDSAAGMRVGDVATVRDGAEEVVSYARLNGEPVVLLEVRKVTGANSVAVSNTLRRTLEGVPLPTGYRTEIVGDSSVFVAASVEDTLTEMVLAAVAVSLIVLLFTGRLGSVLAVVLAIPVSIAGALIVINLFGFTFNIITLLAITVAIGLVVDDAIVVAENIDRYREEGLSRRESVLKGASAVSTAVLAATLSLLAVFIPISLLPGVVGQFFSQFGVTLAAAIAFSYLEAMFFLTVRLALSPDPYPPGWRDLGGAGRKLGADARWSARNLRRLGFWLLLLVAAGATFALQLRVAEQPLGVAAASAAGVVVAAPLLLFVLRYLGRLVLFLLGALSLTLYRAGDFFIGRVRGAYVRSLRAALTHAWVVLVLAAGLFGSLFWVFPRIGFNFQPPDDSGLIGATLELPAGTSLAETNRVAGTVESYLLADPVVESVQVTVGSGDILGGSNAGLASFTVQLVPKDERALDTSGSIVALERELTELLRPFPEAELSLSNSGSGPPGSSGYTLSLSSADLGLLRERSDAALEVLESTPGLRNVASDLSSTTDERVFVVDPAQLDGTGLTNSDIFNTLAAYNVGSEAGRLRQGGDETPIRVRADPLLISDEQSLLSLPIQAPALGSSLPLSTLGGFETRTAPATISRANQSYSATLTAELTPGSSLSQVTASVDARLSEAGILDNQVSQEQGVNFDLLGDLLFYAPIAFGLALLLNYLAIGSQFNSFKYPLYLLLTVPLALVGAVWLFYATGTSLDIISVLGVVMLIGLVTKNAILLLDVALAETRGGAPLKDALLEAANVRFRPIVMTTTTVVVISLPLLLGLGEGSEFRYPLGLVILGGVVTSALLTLYVVPAAFYRFERHSYPAERPPGPEAVAVREGGRSEVTGVSPRPAPSLSEGSS
jgi:hydrophobic/amphiphilic exporter-1 (mainly G- bacteria), HAE1 family